MQENKTYCIDCFEGIKMLADNSVSLVITSPPYAMQRKIYYGGICEKNYPQWTVDWLELLKPKLKDDASVCINIRPHIKNGQLSDYVAETVRQIRRHGWIECEELIWYKPDSPPMGSIQRPRRAWESIKWFCKTNHPKCKPKKNGFYSNRIGFEQSKFEESNSGYVHKGQNKAKAGISRCTDVIVCGTSKIEKGYSHPAMFPPEVPEYVIKMMTDVDDLVVDPFMGSGTTGRVAERLKRRWIGFEINNEYMDS